MTVSISSDSGSGSKGYWVNEMLTQRGGRPSASESASALPGRWRAPLQQTVRRAASGSYLRPFPSRLWTIRELVVGLFRVIGPVFAIAVGAMLGLAISRPKPRREAPSVGRLNLFDW